MILLVFERRYFSEKKMHGIVCNVIRLYSEQGIIKSGESVSLDVKSLDLTPL